MNNNNSFSIPLISNCININTVIYYDNTYCKDGRNELKIIPYINRTYNLYICINVLNL